ncbi:MAG: hypothetical protein LC663_03835, partial [Actinobacteria bacterium]|nr:hypothetical protein [Actinomycetota bacterium]
MKRLAPVALALALIGTSCFGARPHRDPSVLQMTSGTGTVQTRSGSGWATLSNGARVRPGNAVRVLANSDVVLARGDRSSIELRAIDGLGQIDVGSDVGSISLSHGEVLVQSDATAPITVASGGTTARATGALFRFDRRLRVRIGSFSGSVSVNVERSVSLPALPSLDEWLVNPRVAPVREAYSLDTSDAWDRRLLPDAVEAETETEPLATGYEARFGARTASVAELDPIAKDAG